MSESVIIERNEDMSPMGRLALILQEDGDVIVAVRPDPHELHQTSVEFCQPFSGGGRSPATLKALKALADAMKRDNAEHPIFTDPSRQLPPFDPNRYRSVKEMRAEIDRLRTGLNATNADMEQIIGDAKVQPLGTITVCWRKGGAQGEPWDPSMTGRHVMIPAQDSDEEFGLYNWFAGPRGWENIVWWVPAEELKPPEIVATP